jgi:ribosomal protein S3
MGQKTNPIIARLGKTKKWKIEYVEKKNHDISKKSYNSLEIKEFIHRFFYKHGIIISDYRSQYTQNNTLQIFLTYYVTLNSVLNISNLNKNQQFVLKKKSKKKKRKKFFLQKKLKNCINYKVLKSKLNKVIKNVNIKKVKQVIKYEKKLLKIKRLKTLQWYKQMSYSDKHKKAANLISNNFINKLFESLKIFNQNNIKILLNLKQLNKNLKLTTPKQKKKLLKKKLVNLRKYKNNDFFKEGLNTFFICTDKFQTAELLAIFISNQLQKLKRHNFFIKFIKNALTIFQQNSLINLKGIKIKIKGRLNGAPRAKHKILKIGTGIPVLNFKSNIDYAEKTAFTSNGTLGVKVWTY